MGRRLVEVVAEPVHENVYPQSMPVADQAFTSPHADPEIGCECPGSATEAQG